MKQLSKNYALDSTLRYMYIALRNRRCRLMAIEFEHGGKKYRADTVEEAVQLRNRLEMSDRFEGSWADTAQRDLWTPDKLLELLNNTGDLQKKFLAALAHETRLNSEQMVERLGLDSEVALAGVLSGLSKQLGKMSLKTFDLYNVEVFWKGKNKTRIFSLAPSFLFTANEVAWPDAWEKSKKKGASDAVSTNNSAASK